MTDPIGYAWVDEKDLEIIDVSRTDEWLRQMHYPWAVLVALVPVEES